LKATKIFVNLPVKDLQRSIDFFTQLGFTFNPQFTDETATCLILGDNLFAMLLTEKRFKDFIKKPIGDATKATEVLVAIELNSREEVDFVADKAMAHGGGEVLPAQDHGWMYNRTFSDPDGHHWEVAHMDESKIPG